jgi:hypothetical protein
VTTIANERLEMPHTGEIYHSDLSEVPSDNHRPRLGRVASAVNLSRAIC